MARRVVARRQEDRVRERSRESRVHWRVSMWPRAKSFMCRRVSIAMPIRRGRLTASGSRFRGGPARRLDCRRRTGRVVLAILPGPASNPNALHAQPAIHQADVAAVSAAAAAAVVVRHRQRAAIHARGSMRVARRVSTRATFRRWPHTVAAWWPTPPPGAATEFWHNAPRDSVFTTANNMVWADDQIILPVTVPSDEWDRWYGINLTGGDADASHHDRWSRSKTRRRWHLTRDGGKTLFYCTNATDIERRHIWTVPTGGGTPRRVSHRQRHRDVSAATRVGQAGGGDLLRCTKTPASMALVPTAVARRG